MAFKKEDSMDALTKQVQQLGINGSKKESTVAVTAEEPVLDSARAALVEAISQRQKLMGKVTEASKRNSTRAFPDEAICKHAQAVTKLMQEQDQALDKLLVEFAMGPAAEKDAKKTSKSWFGR
ncbi:TPA: hypothetical protein ACH3X2_002108 [Trebouxia sp. C0005]